MPRIAALLFALAIAVAPVATTVCEALCATHERADSATDHACHDRPDADGPAVNGASPHLCGHVAAALPTALGQALQTLAPPAVLSTAFVPVPVSLGVTALASAAEHSPPGDVALISQLRV